MKLCERTIRSCLCIFLASKFTEFTYPSSSLSHFPPSNILALRQAWRFLLISVCASDGYRALRKNGDSGPDYLKRNSSSTSRVPHFHQKRQWFARRRVSRLQQARSTRTGAMGPPITINRQPLSLVNTRHKIHG